MYFRVNIYVIIRAKKELGHTLESVSILVYFVDVECSYKGGQ